MTKSVLHSSLTDSLAVYHLICRKMHRKRVKKLRCLKEVQLSGDNHSVLICWTYMGRLSDFVGWQLSVRRHSTEIHLYLFGLHIRLLFCL